MQFFAPIVAAAPITASPTPTPAATPVESPTPAATPPVTLAGIYLGEDIGAALRGMPLMYSPSQHGVSPDPDKVQEISIDLGPGGHMYLFYDTVVRQINIIARNRDQFDQTDPYGVAIGDSQARLTQLRGTPALVNDQGFWFYVFEGKIRWIYQFLDGRVVQISVDDLIGHP